MFWEDILGKIEDQLPPPNPARVCIRRAEVDRLRGSARHRRRRFAWGVLLLPKDLQPGERRPVVVCQHGRHGLPAETIQGDVPAYRNFAARLAEQGFVVLAPHNLYQKEDYYRTLARKAHTVGLTHWSVILRHHQQWLAWLASLPQVDPQRIGFYGLSFGGESAMRLPSLLDGYALSICSGDFNAWTRKSPPRTTGRASCLATSGKSPASTWQHLQLRRAELSHLSPAVHGRARPSRRRGARCVGGLRVCEDALVLRSVRARRPDGHRVLQRRAHDQRAGDL